MASEYLKKLAKDVKPEEKRELTPQEKRRNWWYYHRVHVVIGAVALLLAGLMVRDIVRSKTNLPDYQVAFVGASYLPEDTAAALENALAELGEDLNGDGQVLVRVNEYVANAEQTDFTASYGAQVQLMADASEGESFFYLMEDPALLQEQFGLLAYPDGTLPGEEDLLSEELWFGWAECPVLAGLELGSYTVEVLDSSYTGDSQELLSKLYIARRGYGEDADMEQIAGCEALWEKLIAGAE